MSAIEDGAMQDKGGAQVSELVRRARASLIANPLVGDLADALEFQSAELTRLREQSTTDLTVIQSLNREAHALRNRNAELEKVLAGINSHRNALLRRNDSLETTVGELREALSLAESVVGKSEGEKDGE